MVLCTHVPILVFIGQTFQILSAQTPFRSPLTPPPPVLRLPSPQSVSFVCRPTVAYKMKLHKMDAALPVFERLVGKLVHVSWKRANILWLRKLFTDKQLNLGLAIGHCIDDFVCVVYLYLLNNEMNINLMLSLPLRHTEHPKFGSACIRLAETSDQVNFSTRKHKNGKKAKYNKRNIKMMSCSGRGKFVGVYKSLEHVAHIFNWLFSHELRVRRRLGLRRADFVSFFFLSFRSLCSRPSTKYQVE